MAHLENSQALRRSDLIKLKKLEDFLKQWPIFKSGGSQVFVCFFSLFLYFFTKEINSKVDHDFGLMYPETSSKFEENFFSVVPSIVEKARNKSAKAKSSLSETPDNEGMVNVEVKIFFKYFSKLLQS